MHDLESRLLRGDPGIWPHWNPEILEESEVAAAWDRALTHRGEPGVPEDVHLYAHFPQDLSAHARFADHFVGVVEEIRARWGRLAIATARLGGGTPTAMPRTQLDRCLGALSSAFDVSGEFTCDVRSTTLDADTAALVGRYGVDRISIGIQSPGIELADRGVGSTLVHTEPDVNHIAASVRHARAAGLRVNVDLVLGLPGQSAESFAAVLDQVMEREPDTVTVVRFQSLPGVEYDPPLGLRLSRIVGRVRAVARRHRYVFSSPDHDQEVGVRFVRLSDRLVHRLGEHLRRARTRVANLSARALRSTSWAAERLAAQADQARAYGSWSAEPSHVLGIGPGSFSHVFGSVAYRDVTSLDALPVAHPVLLGTRLTPADECAQRLVRALWRNQPAYADQLEKLTGVDFRLAFARQIESGCSDQTLELRGARVCSELAATFARKREVLVAFLPPRSAPDSNLPDAVSIDAERALVEATTSRRGNDALLREWCEAIDVPDVGARIDDAWVRRIDDSSVHFSVGSRTAPRLRVLVGPPGVKSAFASSNRFSITHASRVGVPLTEVEQDFLANLARRMKVADHPRERTARR